MKKIITLAIITILLATGCATGGAQRPQISPETVEIGRGIVRTVALGVLLSKDVSSETLTAFVSTAQAIVDNYRDTGKLQLVADPALWAPARANLVADIVNVAVGLSVGGVPVVDQALAKYLAEQIVQALEREAKRAVASRKAS